MVKHIVMFRVKEFPSKEEKLAKLQEIKAEMENFINVIPEIQQGRAGININDSESWDVVLEVETKNMKELAVYVAHPVHQAFVKNIMAPVKADRACVDYIMD